MICISFDILTIFKPVNQPFNLCYQAAKAKKNLDIFSSFKGRSFNVYVLILQKSNLIRPKTYKSYFFLKAESHIKLKARSDQNSRFE